MKKTLWILILSVAFSVYGQDYQVPKNVVLKTDADYDKYEADIIKCADWLINSQVSSETAKRKEANSFLLLWLTGSSKVSIEIKEEIVNFTDAHAEILFIFMAGWTKYVLETKDFKNKVMGSVKGVEAVITFYKNNKESVKKDENIEKYIKMKEDGTLEKYIKKNI